MSSETTICPHCGAEASGSFCARCGAALKRPPCPSCGESPSPGARFCNHCGAALHEETPPGAPGGAIAGVGGGDGGGSLGWWVAGALLLALILVITYPLYLPSGADEPPPSGAGEAGPGAGTAGPLNMSMEEAAYRLFVRVMSAADTADTATVEMFRPMAISAYEQTAPLTDDARYHMALIHQVAGDHAAALEVAGEGLRESPDHLLLLSAAGESALALGDTAAALERFGHLLEVWEEEVAVGRPEYADHDPQMPEIRQRAREVVEGAS